ncbi:hypothetical protein BAUCODRAFT_152866 [Baudoinia panamericana UAMH 10762]|uniref:Uncharacterized protein n=1 Tax=Baudoinia panamericana (strain UAMH 10762) TaxID=717646 RepID=M2M2R3_BAUPA|nr:uncharacterized protein BAUCODRAFT_152866 [Baudoinia panamericana UAMH 10762]EMC90816.1 hypothetical protein BAUCODRAFT_152866 [Baudoinia panamericana UAMH 10762]
MFTSRGGYLLPVTTEVGYGATGTESSVGQTSGTQQPHGGRQARATDHIGKAEWTPQQEHLVAARWQYVVLVSPQTALQLGTGQGKPT